jgi:hypothetical protein
MRPIPPRAPAGDQSSQDAIHAIVAGSPMPMGIPALFIADQLSRGRSADQVLRGKRGLLAEYAGAEGYACPWGQLIESRLGRYILWRVVPVAMWDHLVERREGSPLLIEELLTRVQPGIRPALRRHLPRHVLLAGCQGASRRSPHALFALLLADPAAATAVRQWLATPFVTELLPPLLSRVERRVEEILRRGSP